MELKQPKFKLGEIILSHGVTAFIIKPNGYDQINEALEKYKACNWGDLEEEDKLLNDNAIKFNNDRILARYKTTKGDIYIITSEDRSNTQILFCKEY